MNDYIVTEEEFEKIKEEVRCGIAEYTSMPEGYSKKIKYKELYVLLIRAREYYSKKFRKKRVSEEKYRDQFQDMIERALENYNPELGDFWNYFNNGFMWIRKEADDKDLEKKILERRLVTDEEYYNGANIDSIKESDLGLDPSCEEEYILEDERERKIKDSMEAFSEIVNLFIMLKESMKSKKTNTIRYQIAFLTGDIVAILKNAYKKTKGIDAEDAREIFKRDEKRNLSTLDMDLLEYTYVVKPTDIDGISDIELKKYKDISVVDCRNPDIEIKVPFEVKNVYVPYFKDVHSIIKNEQTFSTQHKNYRDLLGKYAPQEW